MCAVVQLCQITWDLKSTFSNVIPEKAHYPGPPYENYSQFSHDIMKPFSIFIFSQREVHISPVQCSIWSSQCIVTIQKSPYKAWRKGYLALFLLWDASTGWIVGYYWANRLTSKVVGQWVYTTSTKEEIKLPTHGSTVSRLWNAWTDADPE